MKSGKAGTPERKLWLEVTEDAALRALAERALSHAGAERRITWGEVTEVRLQDAMDAEQEETDIIQEELS